MPSAFDVVMDSRKELVQEILKNLEKGYLFNNAYIYASKKERETMNKKPHYRQTAVIFFMMGMIFLLLGAAILLDAFWITYMTALIILVMLVYAVVSGIAIEKEKQKK